MRRASYLSASVVATAGFAAMALKFLPVPFAWIDVGGAFAAFAGAALAVPLMRLPLVIAASLSLSFGLGELVLPSSPLDREYQEQPPLQREHPILGWSLKPSQVSRAVVKIGGQLVYDAKYTTDSDGHRVSPPDRGDRVEGCLFFFTDSFVFGTGVNDHQTLPYQVGLQTDGRFRVVNFGVGGYGAEHILAAIDQGSLAGDPPCKPTHVFYLALPHHILRASGKPRFSKPGPRYVLNPDGNPEYLGTGQAARRGWRDRVANQLDKSRILLRLSSRERPATADELALYFAIVKRSFQLFQDHWPEAELHVISWDLGSYISKGQARFHTGLQAAPVELHFVDDILPGYSADPTKYGLHPADPHPNPTSHEMVASYLVKQVLRSD